MNHLCVNLGTEALPAMTTKEICAEQKQDPIKGQILYFKNTNNRPPRSMRIGRGRHGHLLMKEWRKLAARNGILYRCISDGQRGVMQQLILPEKLRVEIKTALHDNSGHFGFERTLHLIRKRFSWPNMSQEIKARCEQCDSCCLCKITGNTKIHNTPYHPQGNGTTEMFNWTLMNMVGTLQSHMKPRWHEHMA